MCIFHSTLPPFDFSTRRPIHPSPRIPLDKINSFIDCETNFSPLSLSIYLSPLVPDKNIFHSRDTREGTIEEGAENCERGMDLVNLRVDDWRGRESDGGMRVDVYELLARISFPIRFPTALLGTFSSDRGRLYRHFPVPLFHSIPVYFTKSNSEELGVGLASYLSVRSVEF